MATIFTGDAGLYPFDAIHFEYRSGQKQRDKTNGTQSIRGKVFQSAHIVRLTLPPARNESSFRNLSKSASKYEVD